MMILRISYRSQKSLGAYLSAQSNNTDVLMVYGELPIILGTIWLGGDWSKGKPGNLLAPSCTASCSQKWQQFLVRRSYVGPCHSRLSWHRTKDT